MSASNLQSIEKLKGRENFATWQFAMENFLELMDLGKTIKGTEQDEAKLRKAKASIILAIEPINYVHVQEAQTPKEVWDNLKTVFEDSGLYRKIGLIRTLVTTQLEECGSVEDYVNKIISTAHKLNGIGCKLDDSWIGAFLLAGLPEKYNTMIMGLESSGIKITADAIKTKLIQEINTPQQVENAFFNKYGKYKNVKINKKGKGVRCYSCNGRGHKASDCYKNKKSDEKEKVKNGAFSAVFLSGNFNKEEWYIDSGASMHMTCNEKWLKNIEATTINEIIVANSKKMSVISKGDIQLNLKTDKVSSNITIKNVLCVPGLITNLLSVSQIIKAGNVIEFKSDGCFIYNKNKELLATGILVNNVYKLSNFKILNLLNINVEKENKIETIELWHRRLGHMNVQDLKKMKNGIVNGINFQEDQLSTCITCLKGKQTRKPFKHSENCAEELLDLIHSDLCGPMETRSLGNSLYFLTIIDDFSRKVFIYFLKSKTEVLENFKVFKKTVEIQTSRKIKCVRSDNGLEYCNKDFKNFLKQSGIIHQTTNPYTPEQNGVAERMNRRIVEMAKCMIFEADFSYKLWAEAVNLAVYIINRSYTSALKLTTPEEAWTGVKPDLSQLKIFGCDVMMHVPKQKRTKWSPKSIQMKFLGYESGTKGYRLLNLNTMKITKSRDVVFLENKIKNNIISTNQVLDKNSETKLENEEVEQSLNESNQIEDFDYTIDDSRNLDPDYVTNYNFQNNNNSFSPRRTRSGRNQASVNYITSEIKEVESDPLDVKEALSRSDAGDWKAAMKEEIDALIENNTWELTELPFNKQAIKSKWVFKIKYNPDGTISKYKARLVVKGCSQKQGIDYQETFSPVVRYSTLRFLIALAVKLALKIDQMDAVSAFLQGELSDEIYLFQPEEFDDGSKKVCRLKKGIYGLKQASRVWNKKLDGVIKNLGLIKSKVDPCIYYKIDGKVILIIAVYVDDLLILYDDHHYNNKIKQKLKLNFKMKDLGEASHCLGMKIIRDEVHKTISLSQSQYIKQILQRFNMENCNPITTPVDTNQKLSKSMSPKNEKEKEEMSNVPYQEAVGCLLYLAQCTRPDIAYAVNSVSRYNSDPGKAHWVAVKRIFRYLKATINLRLEFANNKNANIIGFSDADWASDVDRRRSCTGYVFTLQGGAISWNSKRQPTVALSSTEAEYMALASATQEAMWLKQLQSELDKNCINKHIIIYCDNHSAIHLSENEAYHPRSKHIEVRHHFLREKVSVGDIKIISISTNDMVADNLTKGVPTIKHNYCSKEMGLIMIND